MFETATLSDGLLGSSVHLVYDRDTRAAFIVDAGFKTAHDIVSRVRDLDLRVAYILLTHEHYDHIWCADELRAALGVPIVCSKICADAIQEPTRNLSRYASCGDCRTSADIRLTEKADGLPWAGGLIRMLATPGHSPGSACYLVGNLLISGDTLIANTRTVTKLPGGNRLDLVSSLLLLSGSCPEKALILPGHGAPFRIAAEADKSWIPAAGQAS